MVSAVRGAAQPAGQSFVLVVSGIGGEQKYVEDFHAWGAAMADAVERRFGVPRANVTYLAEEPARAPARTDGRSTRENVGKALADIAARSAPGDRVLIVLIGHGSAQSREARFNLPGPDMSAADFAALLRKLPGRSVALVNASSASGDFVPALSARDRIIITATKSGMERNETLFGRYFVEAFVEDGADVDKDGRVSLLEAFEYARREVRRAYEVDNRLLTEHALLDDNGDGAGTAVPSPPKTDGALARAFHLGAGASVASASNPSVRALLEEKRALEEKIADLRGRKDGMDSVAYARQLEELLVALALKNREIRAAEATP